MTTEPHTGPGVVPGAVPPGRLLYWSVRRELWEHRSLVIAPLAVAGVTLFGFLVSLRSLPAQMRTILGLDAADQLSRPYHIIAAVILGATLIVGVVYALGALHNERRDRSILFWKSLPVSDLIAVLAKAGILLVVLPVIALAIVLATQAALLLASTLVLIGDGPGLQALWTGVPWLVNGVTLAYGVVVMALWYAPVNAWLLLVSGWAKRVVFLWAVLPPIGLAIVERIALGTSNLGHMLGYRLTGGLSEAFGHGGSSEHGLPHSPVMDPAAFLASPGLWVGLAFAAAFVAGAVWLRRRREPI